jgi:hypothetical protein
MSSISESIKSSTVSSIANPFTKGNIDRIDMHISKKLFQADIIEYVAVIRFNNGNTSGSHRIESNSFDELMIKVKSELASL